jgi:sulfatase modifying factor 1
VIVFLMSSIIGCGDKSELVFVKGGCFQMGDTFGVGENDEKPVHDVCVDDFYLGKYEVTQGQWKKVMGSNPSYFNYCGDDCPVEWVSWNDIQEFISKANSQSGKKYRLPTAAEWEYAASSGGKKEKWAGISDEKELDDYVLYEGNSLSKTHPVGQKKPNGLGIYDMSGNVWEWCSDWYSAKNYSELTRNNPQCPSNSSSRVLRGGSWASLAQDSRVADRGSGLPDSRGDMIGFRVAVSSR